MKREIITILVLILLVFLAAAVTVLYFKSKSDNAATKAELKKLAENVEVIVNYDSISTAREKQMFDSLRVVREDFKRQIDLQNDENKKIRTRNAKLEKRFRDLDLGLRPEF